MLLCKTPPTGQPAEKAPLCFIDSQNHTHEVCAAVSHLKNLATTSRPNQTPNNDKNLPPPGANQHPPRRQNKYSILLRKEVIQPHLPVRLPCYDFVPIANPTFDHSPHQTVVRPWASGVTNFHDVTGGVYKARERIHRSIADLRLLATPTSWGRVADPNPN